jgi:hypothetical protein
LSDEKISTYHHDFYGSSVPEAFWKIIDDFTVPMNSNYAKPLAIPEERPSRCQMNHVVQRYKKTGENK